MCTQPKSAESKDHEKWKNLINLHIKGLTQFGKNQYAKHNIVRKTTYNRTKRGVLKC